MVDTLSLPNLSCYKEYANPPDIVPGRSERPWMDATTMRFAYRCTPLSIANASGWDLVLPLPIAATWNGGPLVSDLTIVPMATDSRFSQIVSSVFGHGVLTFHPGYLFRTSPGWALLARGAPNTVKDGIAPLEGLVETDWLPFTFTMNWQFTRPGSVRFVKDESFGFITLVPHAMLDEVQPVVRSLADDPTLKASYEAWRQSRFDFQAGIKGNNPDAVREGWQRDYVHGRETSGAPTAQFHLSKRRLRTPEDRS